MRLIILGAGGHGKVVADLAEQTGKYEEISFLDDNSQDVEVLGKCSQYLKFRSADTEMYPAFGNNTTRVQWENKLLEAGIRLAKIIHPLAYVSPLAEVTSGCVIMPYAVINIGAMVDHDCILEEGCHLAPGAIVKGENHLPAGMKIDSGEVVPLQYYS